MKIMEHFFYNLYRHAGTYLNLNRKDISMESAPEILGNLVLDDLILCNLCGSIFQREGPDHSEFLACPYCDSIARERVAYQIILSELSKRSGSLSIVLNTSKLFRSLTVLECSPRFNPNRRRILGNAFGQYLASDFDLSAHRADIKMDLTSELDILSFKCAFDIILCSHVLEHIPDYSLALSYLYQMLAPGGLLVLQVPILESVYTAVTWDEFHGDNTRVYHRFGFDLLFEMEKFFDDVRPVVGLLGFSITSPEIKQDKYDVLQPIHERCSVLGIEALKLFGLGMPDLCDAFVAYRNKIETE